MIREGLRLAWSDRLAMLLLLTELLTPRGTR